MTTTERPAGTTSHAVKAADLTIAYPKSGPHQGYAVLHATGCRHTMRRNDDVTVVGTGYTWGADDWFQVAPCAR